MNKYFLFIKQTYHNCFIMNANKFYIFLFLVNYSYIQCISNNFEYAKYECLLLNKYKQFLDTYTRYIKVLQEFCMKVKKIIRLQCILLLYHL